MAFVSIWWLLGWFWFVHEMSLHFHISFFAGCMLSVPLMLCSSVWCFIEAERLLGNPVHSCRDAWEMIKRRLNAPITRRDWTGQLQANDASGYQKHKRESEYRHD